MYDLLSTHSLGSMELGNFSKKWKTRHLNVPEIQAIFSNFHNIFTNFDNILFNINTSNRFWLTTFVNRNNFLQKNK